MIVATAGHIDHGKTTLIRALTGVNTDTLPEERARGISIDLGFAHWRPDTGGTVGFIDVPGHERFVRNMLAGVSGIDLALLVVAADDGVMPQTLEHVQILHLLEVPRVVVVLTKKDKVPSERLAQVEQQVLALLAGTRLAVQAVCPVSAVSGDGIPALQAMLAGLAREHRPVRGEERNFRMAVDRVFTMPGRGTIATGTVIDGRVAVGDTLLVSPAGAELRVRGLQRGGVAITQARAGQRCAINVAGAATEAMARGDWLVAPAGHVPTQRLEVLLALLPAEARNLPHGARVFVHIGTRSTIGRVHLSPLRALAPGADAVATLVLDRPVCAANGDRFVLRDQGAMRTIGGGHVLNPVAGSLRAGSLSAAAIAAALRHRDALAALRDLLPAADTELDVATLRSTFNLGEAAMESTLACAQATVFGAPRKVAMQTNRLAALQERLLAWLADLHRTRPEDRGAQPRELRLALAPRLGSDAFLAILRLLTDQRKIAWTGGLVCLTGHKPAGRAADLVLWQRIQPRLGAGGVAPPLVQQLALDLQLKEPLLEDLLQRKRADGEVWKVAKGRYYPRDTVAALAATAARVHAAQGRQGFTAAQFRDAIGTGRTLAIQILEFFDSIGVTRRIGDQRRMLPDFQLLVGAAAPLRAPARAVQEAVHA